MNGWILKSEPDAFSIDDLFAKPDPHDLVGWRSQLYCAKQSGGDEKG
jgi:predicted RNA-binding protein with PUA-like domain